VDGDRAPGRLHHRREPARLGTAALRDFTTAHGAYETGVAAAEAAARALRRR
jgi:hypothetical protein